MIKKILMLFVCVLAFPMSALSDQNLELVCDIWPPYQIKTDSEITGYSVEVLDAVLGNMNDVSGYSLKSQPWKRALFSVSSGQADALFSANYSKERTEFGWYPKEPLIVSKWVVWVKNDSNINFNKLSDLAGLTVGVVRSYSYTDDFWDFIRSKGGGIDEVANDETNFKKLATGRIDYTVAELGNGYYVLNKLNIKGVKPLVTNPIKKDGLYMVFNKERVAEATVADFSNALKKFKKQKKYEEIYNRYFR